MGDYSPEPTNGRGRGAGPRVVALPEPPSSASAGEVPERLNGRDWKSRNGGNLVRGFESLPLRFRRAESEFRKHHARARQSPGSAERSPPVPQRAKLGAVDVVV